MRKQIDKSKCSRCQEVAPSITIRNEGFCTACFIYFINHKFRKPLDQYKVNYQSSILPKLIVPVDFGRNSMCLVQLLMDLLDHQRLKHQRVGFNLECVYIGTGSTDFEWPFSDIKLVHLPVSKLGDFFDLDGSPYKRSTDLSRTSTQDLETWMTRYAIREYARAQRGDTSVLFDYSMSFISELVMAETCKGRGSLVPQLLSPEGCIYPLRDILDSELEIYARVMEVKFDIRPSFPRVSKLQSIDELIHEFLSSTRAQFPAVDSTVGRTGFKLSQEAENCYLCAGAGDKLCYGCTRMLQGREGQKELRTKKPNLQNILDEYEL